MSASGKPFSVYVTRRVPQRGIDILKEANISITQWNSDDPITREEILKNIPGKDALLCLLTDTIDAGIIDAAGPQLKIIATMSVGYEHIDTAACKERGILLSNTPGVSTDAVAELTVALLLAVARRIPEGIHAVKSGEWSTWAPLWLLGHGLNNSTVGIIGLGRIGAGVARRIQSFGIKELLYFDDYVATPPQDIKATRSSFDDVVSKSDFLVAMCPLTENTHGMFNMSVFKMMKSTAVFVNTSRGGVVNQDELYDALKGGVISGAGIDVTVPEPIPVDHKLLSLSNCIVLPHTGSNEVATRQLMSGLAAKNIVAALNGNPLPGQVML